MQVRFTKTVAGPDPLTNGTPGEKRDIPNDKAQALIKAGAVAPVNPASIRETSKAPEAPEARGRGKGKSKE